MARRATEPVRHTCPDIDRVIRKITEIVLQMESCGDGDDKEDILDSISSWSSDLKEIGFGKWNELETLRSSNASLREWGNDMYNEAENLERSLDEAETRCSDLEDRIRELEERIEELEGEE